MVNPVFRAENVGDLISADHQVLKEDRESGNNQSFICTIRWNLAKFLNDYLETHFTSTLHRSETNGIAERAARRIEEEASVVFLQSRLEKQWLADSMEC